MSNLLISTDQINPRPNPHIPQRVALPPSGGPKQSMRPKASKPKSHKRRTNHKK